MTLYMYTHYRTEDYLFKAEDENKAEQIAGLIRAVGDYELGKQIAEANGGHTQLEEEHTLLEEEE